MPGLCLILEPLQLVATDLALTAAENVGLTPLIAEDEGDALAKLAGLGPDERVELALVHQSAAEFAASPLRPILEAAQTRIVLLGAELGVDGEEVEWRVLAWPFSTDQVVALIENLGLMGDRPAGT